MIRVNRFWPTDKRRKVGEEIDKLDENFWEDNKKAQEYLDCRKDELLSLLTVVTENVCWTWIEKKPSLQKLRSNLRGQAQATIWDRSAKTKKYDGWDDLSISRVPIPKAASRDMWKRVAIPVFNSPKRNYECWKTVFMVCTDEALDCEFLRLCQYLSGNTLVVMEPIMMLFCGGLWNSKSKAVLHLGEMDW